MTISGDAISVVPERTAVPPDARTLLRRDGAAILTGCGTGEGDAVNGAYIVLAGEVVVIPDPAAVHEDRPHYGPTVVVPHSDPLPGHTDGFAYGDHYPDHIFLLCSRPAVEGGETILLDAYAIVDALGVSADPDDRALFELLTAVPIEQTEPGYRTSRSKVVQQTATGRRALRRTPFQVPDPAVAGDDLARQTELLERWTALVRALSSVATPFRLEAGELVCVDNYRVLHGRRAFTSLDRLLYRVWAWTTDTLDGPPEGMLHSDQRYAAVS